MSFLKRLWGYIKTLFRTTAERAMDPEIEIEQAIQEARQQDQKLRNQAAKVIAHRTQLEAKIEKVLSRGKLIIDGDEYLDSKGHGQYLKRGTSQMLI